jgi:hypothetical protein
MELKITDFFNNFKNGNDDTTNYQNSIAVSGMKDIGKITWDNAKSSPIHFVTEENKQEVIDYFDAFGAWDDLAEWPVKELNALLIQDIVSNIQDLEQLCEWDWDQYEIDSQAGQISGMIFQSDNDVYMMVTH